MEIKKENYIGECSLAGKAKKRLGLFLKKGSVTTDKIADKAVTKDKLADNAVQESLGYEPLKAVNPNWLEGINAVNKDSDETLSVVLTGDICLDKDSSLFITLKKEIWA